MITGLYVSNIVLIDRLELDLRDGLSVLTGETGAGKSILLDALDLAIGGKADGGLVRAGADGATVIAEFNGDTLLKRVINRDGKSKCYINDEPATQKSLKEAGEGLLEIHGQFANHGLLDENTHLGALDNFGGYDKLLGQVGGAYRELADAEKRLKDLRELVARAAEEREFLEHNVRELSALAPRAGEEAELDEVRTRLMGMEKNAGVLNDAVAVIEQGELADKVFSAAHILERTKLYQTEIDRLYEIGAALNEIAESIAPQDFDVGVLESAEERLFALRAAARKHRVSVDELADALEKMRGDLAAIDDSGAELAKLEIDANNKKSLYEKIANSLTQERIAAAENLRTALLSELPDLKLGQADFTALIKPGAPSATGSDVVRFLIKMNPGMDFAPLADTASGGELARLMLAMRVILSVKFPRTLIFDEIDTGISGATAAAVGARLAALSKAQQVIVITHSAQVAGYGDTHFLISKSTDGKTTTTNVHQIDGADRVGEIARIISGEKITKDSLQAAKALIKV